MKKILINILFILPLFCISQKYRITQMHSVTFSRTENILNTELIECDTNLNILKASKKYNIKHNLLYSIGFNWCKYLLRDQSNYLSMSKNDKKDFIKMIKEGKTNYFININRFINRNPSNFLINPKLKSYIKSKLSKKYNIKIYYNVNISNGTYRFSHLGKNNLSEVERNYLRQVLDAMPIWETAVHCTNLNNHYILICIYL